MTVYKLPSWVYIPYRRATSTSQTLHLLLELQFPLNTYTVSTVWHLSLPSKLHLTPWRHSLTSPPRRQSSTNPSNFKTEHSFPFQSAGQQHPEHQNHSPVSQTSLQSCASRSITSNSFNRASSSSPLATILTLNSSVAGEYRLGKRLSDPPSRIRLYYSSITRRGRRL